MDPKDRERLLQMKQNEQNLTPQQRRKLDAVFKMHASELSESEPAGVWNSVKNFASGINSYVNPVEMVKGLATAAIHPVDTASGIVNAQLDQAKQAYELGRRGGSWNDYLEAAGHGVAAALPLIGPAAAEAGETFGRGEIAKGLGQTVGLVGSVLVPGAAGRKGSVTVPPVFKPQLNPAEAAAIAFADANNIPVDLVMRSGSKWAENIKKAVEHTLPGSWASRRGKAAQAAALEAKGAQLAEKVYPLEVSPQEAGAGVRGGLEAEVLKHNTEAARNYDQLRQFEADPANTRDVPVSTGRSPGAQADLDAFSMSLAGKPFARLQPHEQASVLRTAASSGVDVAERPIMESVPLPVDLRTPKAELGPVVTQLQRQMPIAQQRASTGMKALENIMEAPDFLPTSLADADLSAIKAAARGADLPELRTLSQGLAANAVQKMEDAVAAGVAEAGPAASEARNLGRAATTAKYDTAAVLKQLRDEPVQAFNQLTYGGDSGIEFLRDVRKQTPNEMPKVGRAYLQGLLESAVNRSGEFQGGQGLLKKWQSLGPETKKELFKNPLMVKDLDDFFRLAEMQERNPNRSGSGTQVTSVLHMMTGGKLALIDPWTAAAVTLAPWVVAEMMYSPRAARALTTAMKVPLSQKGAASVAFNNLMTIVDKLEKEQESEKSGKKQ